MQMTNEEIVRRFKNNPTKEHIKALADLNCVKEYEIKRILGNAGIIEVKEKKKPGPKPKKSQENQETEGTLNHNEKKVTLKVDLEKEKLLPEEESNLPVEVLDLIDNLIADCERLIKTYYDAADKLGDEIKILKDFKKGKVHESENGLHRPL